MTDLDIIKLIEKELNIKLENLDALKWDSSGYILDKNKLITGLCLCKSKIIDLHKIIFLIKKLASLTDLTLSEIQLNDITPLSELTNLTRLHLYHNQISNIAPLQKLKNLMRLFLFDNQISDISPLKELNDLKNLFLQNNQINDISPFKELTSLVYLYLDNNQISDLSPLKELTSLTILALHNNQINDVSPLRNLKKLCNLDLRHNPIEKLPPWITDFNMNITWADESTKGYITFYDNPLKTPPSEIVQQGKDAIRNFFRQLDEQDVDYLFEAKMLIIGEPGAGKTTLAWKMENPDCPLPKEAETTKGIDVRQYYFPLQKEDFSNFHHPEKLENRDFRLNLWDFGGQEIYKATHRFFLSKRSLYALVADSRNEDTEKSYPATASNAKRRAILISLNIKI